MSAVCVMLRLMRGLVRRGPVPMCIRVAGHRWSGTARTGAVLAVHTQHTPTAQQQSRGYRRVLAPPRPSVGSPVARARGVVRGLSSVEGLQSHAFPVLEDPMGSEGPGSPSFKANLGEMERLISQLDDTLSTIREGPPTRVASNGLGLVEVSEISVLVAVLCCGQGVGLWPVVVMRGVASCL